MIMHPLTAVVTLCALLVYMATIAAVGVTRGKHGVAAPAMHGHPVVERALRVQGNTLEGLIIFLPALWLFSAYVDMKWGAGLGVAWIIGRIIYMAGYLTDAGKRAPGFGIQALATVVLLLGGLGGAVTALMHAGL
jgi:glutathione S-transferase